MKKLNLISGPRNISTALMYSFAQRPDTVVLDEPFYGFYLHASNADHPGKIEVMENQSIREDDVVSMINGEWEKPVLFIKNMAHHIELLKPGFLDDVTNIFLIRNPKQIIASYAQVIDKPVMRDIGIEYQYKLFDTLRRQGQYPIVVDTGLLLENPQHVLEQVCAAVGIPFFRYMLQWPVGPKPYDGVWAKHWYSNVHQSSGFEKQATSSRSLPQALAALYEQSKHYYEKLLPFSVKP